MKITDEQVEKAVNWWSKVINKPKFDGLSKSERRDPRNKDYQMAELLASALVEEINDEQIEIFKKELTEELKKDDYNPYHGLHVDYHPDPALMDAAEKAGISTNNFPWKTSLWFEEEKVVW